MSFGWCECKAGHGLGIEDALFENGHGEQDT